MARRLITLTHAAEQLALDERTIRRYVSLGLLTGYRIGPRALRVDADEVDALATPIPTAAQ
jgi:excisionase family DNA binding protein